MNKDKLVIVQDPKIVHRISQKNDGRSMWYDRDAVFDPVEEVFAEIPMERDSRQSLEGDWLSSVDDLSLLRLWFPNMGGLLKGMNFELQSFYVKEWVQFPNEIVFNRETAVLEEVSTDVLESLLYIG